MPARKAKKRGTKKAGTKKATKTNLEAKIAKLQAKLNALSAQAAKSAKARALPPKIYTGENYYRTKQRLAYHPPDKQFRRRKAIKFKKFPTVAQVEAATSSQTASKTAKEKKSKTKELAEYEKKYLKRWQQQKSEATSGRSDEAKIGCCAHASASGRTNKWPGIYSLTREPQRTGNGVGLNRPLTERGRFGYRSILMQTKRLGQPGTLY